MARILIVEDDATIAFDLDQQLARHHFETSAVATSRQQALQLLAEPGCEAAVVDFNLGRETSELVMQDLVARRIPFVVVSGCRRDLHQDAFRAAPFVAKPIAIADLVVVLNRLLSSPAP